MNVKRENKDFCKNVFPITNEGQHFPKTQVSKALLFEVAINTIHLMHEMVLYVIVYDIQTIHGNFQFTNNE